MSDVRQAALALGYSLAAPVAGEAPPPLRPAALGPERLRAWAAALADLHALVPPERLPAAPLPDWLAQVSQPWPVDVAPLLTQAAWMRQGASPPAGGARICHRRWWLRHMRFQGEAVASVGGWEAAGLGDPAGDLASVEIGLVADGASAAAAESYAAAFLAAYAEAGGPAPSGLGTWRLALAGEQLATALQARERGERGTIAAAAVSLWARLLGRLLTSRRLD